jgi:hypothetical protein
MLGSTATLYALLLYLVFAVAGCGVLAVLVLVWRMLPRTLRQPGAE